MNKEVKLNEVQTVKLVLSEILCEPSNGVVLGSWNGSNYYEMYLDESVCGVSDGLYGLAIEVDGFSYTGTVFVGYDDSCQGYLIFTKREYGWHLEDGPVSGKNLCERMDRIIDRGDMNEEEYFEKVRASLPPILAYDFD